MITPVRNATASFLVAASLIGGVLPATSTAAQQSFRPYAAGLIDRLVVATEQLAKAVEAEDLQAAKASWISARRGWERGETFLGEFFPEYDVRIDSWPDAEKGFHAVEPLLFEQGDVTAVQELTQKLVGDVHALESAFEGSELSSQGLLDGTAGIVFEIGSEKVSGGESPFSETSLDDMQSNAIGVEAAYALAFAPKLRATNPELHRKITTQIIELTEMLGVDRLGSLNQSRIAALSEELALSLQDAAGELGLKAPQIGG